MQIIENCVIGKKDESACEDGLVITEDFIAVIDGSTSKTPRHLSPAMKNGRYAMLLISQFVRQELSPEADIDKFCRDVTAYIYKVYIDAGVTMRMGQHPEERLTASAIIYSKARNEVWMVGDCQAVIGGKTIENGKPYEEEIAGKRAELIRSGMSPADARKAIEPLLVQCMLDGQNKTYAVIDGFPIYKEGIKVIACPKSHEGQQHIILASDGYPFLKPTLRESEEALSAQLARDPQNIDTFIATKGIVEGNLSFDDRTYIRFLP